MTVFLLSFLVCLWEATTTLHDRVPTTHPNQPKKSPPPSDMDQEFTCTPCAPIASTTPPRCPTMCPSHLKMPTRAPCAPITSATPEMRSSSGKAPIMPEKRFSSPKSVCHARKAPQRFHDAPNGSVTSEKCSSPLENRPLRVNSPDPTNHVHDASTATRKKYLSLRPKAH
ncbi:hypothetical protein BDN67DRAFT_742338 [Paxillus ammoniavirescens]|nr:hypothetical protein BDN67DRAFT_742338 [Paxillus ammoniavirescens]